MHTISVVLQENFHKADHIVKHRYICFRTKGVDYIKKRALKSGRYLIHAYA